MGSAIPHWPRGFLEPSPKHEDLSAWKTWLPPSCPKLLHLLYQLPCLLPSPGSSYAPSLELRLQPLVALLPSWHHMVLLFAHISAQPECSPKTIWSQVGLAHDQRGLHCVPGAHIPVQPQKGTSCLYGRTSLYFCLLLASAEDRSLGYRVRWLQVLTLT